MARTLKQEHFYHLSILDIAYIIIRELIHRNNSNHDHSYNRLLFFVNEPFLGDIQKHPTSIVGLYIIK